MGYLEYALAIGGLYLAIGIVVALATSNKPPPAVQRSKFSRMINWPFVVFGK